MHVEVHSYEPTTCLEKPACAAKEVILYVGAQQYTSCGMQRVDKILVQRKDVVAYGGNYKNTRNIWTWQGWW